MKRFFTLLLAFGASISLWAAIQKVAIDNVIYNINTSTKTAEVTYQGNTLYSNFYRGDVVIPATVSNKGVEYAVTSVGDYAFANCNGLSSVKLPSSVVTVGSSAFRECSALTSVDLSDVTVIGSYAFYGCKSLEQFEMPQTVTQIDEGVFEYCTGLQEIVLSDHLEQLGMYAFQFCENLRHVQLPAGLKKLDNSAFSQCKNLETLSVPANVAVIEEYAFRDCAGLKKITFEGNSILNTIGNKAFINCSSLESIVLPVGVYSIGSQAFKGCSSLASVYVLNPTPVKDVVKYSVFSGIPTDAVLYVPCGDANIVSAYEQEWYVFSTVKSANTSTFSLTLLPKKGQVAAGYAEILSEPTCDENSYLVQAVANEGYRFTTWSDGSVRNPRTVYLTSNLELIAKFELIGDTPPDDPVNPQDPEQQKNYSVVYYNVDNVQIGTQTYKSGNQIIPLTAPAMQCHTFSAWLQADGSPLPLTMPKQDKENPDPIEVTATYTQNMHTISFYVDGELSESRELACGEEIVLPELPAGEECVAYSAWLLRNGGNVPSVMPDYDLTAETKATAASFVLFNDYNHSAVQKQCGQRIYANEMPEVTPQPCQKFIAWVDEDGNEIDFSSFTMPNHDLHIDAKFELTESQFKIFIHENNNQEPIGEYPLHCEESVWEFLNLLNKAELNTDCEYYEESAWTVFGGDWIPDYITEDIHVNINSKPVQHKVTFIIGDKQTVKYYTCDQAVVFPQVVLGDCEEFRGWKDENGNRVDMSDEIFVSSEKAFVADIQQAVHKIDVYLIQVNADMNMEDISISGRTPIRSFENIACGTDLSLYMSLLESQKPEVSVGARFFGWYDSENLLTGHSLTVMPDRDVAIVGIITPDLQYPLMLYMGNRLVYLKFLPQGIPVGELIINGSAVINGQTISVSLPEALQQCAGIINRTTGEVVTADLKMPNDALILEAVCGEEDIPDALKPTVTFYNGNTIIREYKLAPGAVIVEPTLPLSGCEQFNGWYIIDSDGNRQVLPGNMPKTDLAVYADIVIPAYRLTILNGGQQVSKEVKCGENLTIYSLTSGMEIDIPQCKQLSGWEYSNSGVWVPVPNVPRVGLSFDMPAADTYLRPVFTGECEEPVVVVEPHDVYYHYYQDNQLKDLKVISDIKVGENIYYTLPSDAEISALGLKNYIITGWTGYPTDWLMPAEDVHIFAIMQPTSPAPKFTVFFYADDALIFSEQLEEGSFINLPRDPRADNTCKTFSHWADEQGNVITANSYMPAHTLYIYAQYISATYTLSFYDGNELLEQFEVEAGSRNIPTAAAPEAKEGWVFDGWSGVPDVMPCNDVRADAKWVIDVTYHTVTYIWIDNEGAVHKEEQNYNEGDVITLIADPVRDNMDFMGWNGLDGLDTDNAGSYLMPNHDVILVAEFQPTEQCEKYTLTVKWNRAQGDVEFLQEPSCENGNIAKIQAVANQGYEFAGWSDGNTGNPRTLQLESNQILVANFRAQSAYVSYNVEVTVNDDKMGIVEKAVRLEPSNAEVGSAIKVNGEYIRIDNAGNYLVPLDNDLVCIVEYEEGDADEAVLAKKPSHLRGVTVKNSMVNIEGHENQIIDIFDYTGQIIYTGKARKNIRLPYSGEYLLRIENKIAVIIVK